MDSINQNQPEDNFKNLSGKEGLTKIKELADAAKSCFFCTNINTGKPFDTRPMAPEKIDDEGNFWFLSADDSNKNREIQQNSATQLLFQGGNYSEYMSLYGTTEISKDKEKIKELWDPTMKTWFTEGQDDPRITVLKFIPFDGYYWDTKHGMAVAFAKRLYGSLVGETYDDSVEGKITPEN